MADDFDVNPDQQVNQTNPFGGAFNQLFGTGGQDRYQLWPERMVREAFEAPQAAIRGDYGPVGSREFAERAVPGALAMQNLALSGLANPEMAGSAGVLGGKLTAVRPSETAPVFYSNAYRAIENSSLNKASPEQWQGFLKNAPGVKQEELEWAGVHDFLGGQSGQITKQDFLNHLADNGVQLNEVYKRNATGLNDQEYLDKTGQSAKFSSYQMPGGKNYRELLLTLPSHETRAFSVKKNPNGTWSSYDTTGRFGSSGGTFFSQAEASADAASRNLERRYGDNGTNFYSPHWDEPNILAHMRVNDRDVVVQGQDKPLRTLFLEELQSDWHQQGRRQGYKSEKVNAELDKATLSFNDKISKIDDLTKAINAADDKVFSLQKADLRNPSTEGLRAVQEAQKEYSALVSQRESISAESRDLAQQMQQLREAASGNVPNAPFKTSWPELALKRVLREAAEDGYDAIGWTPGDVQANRYDLSKRIKNIQYDRDHNQLAFTEHNGNSTNLTQVTPDKLADYIGKEAAEKIMKQPPIGYFGLRELSGLDLKVGGEGMSGFYDNMLPSIANKLAKKYGGTRVEQGNIPREGQHHEELRTGRYSQQVHVLRLTPALKNKAVNEGFPLFEAGGPVPVADESKRKKLPGNPGWLPRNVLPSDTYGSGLK